jgi:uncharacterized protein (TIGR03437 family)
VPSAIAPPAAAQNFDTSANAMLKGDYLLRQVITAKLDPRTSAVGQAFSLTGVINFDGKGGYSFSGQRVDSTKGSAAQAYSVNGVYSVAANGMAQLQNPIDATDTEFGGVTSLGPAALIASAIEGSYRDLLVAVPAGSAASNNTVNGTFQTGFIDFQQANASQVRDGYFTLTSTGSGSFGNITINGAMANQGNNNVQQSFSAVTYSITGANGSGTISFPTSSTPLQALVSGQKTLFVSSDGNLLLGGDPNGFDLFVGVKSGSSAITNSMFQGTYFLAALENDATNVANGNNGIDTNYGSTLALGDQGVAIYHSRVANFNSPAFDYTSDFAFNFPADGIYNDGTYQNLLAASGQSDVQVGTGSFYSLELNFAAVNPSMTGTSGAPLIGATGIFNAASYAPITNAVAPGEFVTLFGSNLASTEKIGSVPLPPELANVSVTVNGRPAPLSFVSSGQINLVVPYATTEPFATFQVSNNGAKSNQVTVYTNLNAPGIFTLTNNGGTFPPAVGPAAVLHVDYSLVTPGNPAKAGETLQLYLTGLGAVSPAVADGAAAPSNTLSRVINPVFIDIFDQNGVDSPAIVTFAGLAPGFAGLYQVNFTVPSGVASGLATLNLATNQATTSEAKLYMQ